MIDTQAKLATYIKLLEFVVVLGMLGAVVPVVAINAAMGAPAAALTASLFAALFTLAFVQRETSLVIAVV